ncbi:MAG TPA: GtrA family protein [Bacillota bacterium]|nr:GtrA family protein [Clostridiales bacterium]HPT84472.1 GtrA family protein [Bacillota bacterium]
MKSLAYRTRELYNKYRELILYVFFGALTTGVDFGSYWALTRLCGAGETVSQAISVALAIVFAYVVNKIWVFSDRRTGFWEVAKQFISFASMRIISGAFQVGCVWLFVERMGLYDMAVKLVAAVVVVLSNYVFSKLFIFAGKK